MRHGVRLAPLPLPPLYHHDIFSPPPPPAAVNNLSPLPPPILAGGNQSVLLTVFIALILPCVGMGAVFLIYTCVIWYAARFYSQTAPAPPTAMPKASKGLSASDLEKLPKLMGKELVLGTECAVCLDEIESEQAARVVPGCRHGFHLECADTWLSKHSVCPVCRAELDARFFATCSEKYCSPC